MARVTATQPKYVRPAIDLPDLRFTRGLALDRFTISMHGLPDSGKTTCAATAPSPFFVATEPATAERLAAMGLRIPYAEAYTYRDMVRVLKRLPVWMKGVGAKTLAVDTWSTFSDNLYVEILNRVRSHFAGATDDGEDVGIEHFNPNVEGPIWNEVFRLQNAVRRKLDQLGTSVIYVCHTRIASSFSIGRNADEAGGGVPDAQGQFRSRLLRYPGATFYVERRKVRDPKTKAARTVVALHTTETPDGYAARCKWPGIDPIEPPHIGKLIDKVRAYVAAKGAATATVRDNATT